MQPIDKLKIKLFADGADIDSILRFYRDPLIKGFTTNPTLMRKAGIKNYECFGRDLLARVPDRPISLEVFADDLPTMESQARKIASWAKNVVVKIPVTNTKGESTAPIIRTLVEDGIVLNITALMTLEQVETVVAALNPDVWAIVSIFAGRVADTGIDPVPLMKQALDAMKGKPKAELLWASPRELLNVFQADAIGTHIITATPDILSKLQLYGKNLNEFSLETVKMFYDDAAAAAFTI
jgi:transaldolase